ncbi:hypothetical protein SAMN05192578_1188 [Sphingobacterium mizutaii]|nr:hypothetical protein SAMN05192578_1188 [Sphingobacterium mizutaii]
MNEIVYSINIVDFIENRNTGFSFQPFLTIILLLWIATR